MSGSHSRRKGQRGELEAAELLRPLFPRVRRRVAGEESQGTNLGRDLVNTGRLCVQVNLSNRPVPEKKLRQAENACANGDMPVAFTRTTGGEWAVTLRPKDFMALLAAAMDQRGDML